MSWYLAPSLAVLRAEINARWPNRDKTSDGSIGDAAHQASTSDHNPNSRGSVDAIDVDKDGVDVAAIIAAFQRHPSAHYWIYQQVIADKDDGWRRRTYTGSNPHDHHAHFSIRQSATAEQDRRPWALLEDDMTPEDLLDTEILNPITGKPAKVRTFLVSMNSEAYRGRLLNEAILAAVKGLDTKAVLARINEVATADATRDAELAELVRASQNGELAAEEFVRRVGELFTAAGTPQS